MRHTDLAKVSNILVLRAFRQSTCIEAKYEARPLPSDMHCATGTVIMNAKRRKILVADCHDDTLIILEKLLEDAGFDTTTVWTAKDALRLLDSKVFDLVLINTYLPDADCQTLLKVLRNKGQSLTYIVMLPKMPEMTDFRSFEALGARDVVCKYSYRQVLETVSERLACREKSLFAA